CVLRVDLEERLLLQRLLQFRSPLGEGPFIDEQRVGEEQKGSGRAGSGATRRNIWTERSGRGAREAFRRVAPDLSAARGGLEDLIHLLLQLLDRVEAHVRSEDLGQLLED